MEKPLKILWLAPLRPAPWIMVLANELAKRKDVNLTILRFNSGIKKKIKIHKEINITNIYLKIPRSRINIFTAYFLPTKRLTKYLEENIHSYDLVHIHGTEQRHFVSSYKFNIPQVLSIQGILTEVKKFVPFFDRRYIAWNIGSYYEKKYLKYIDNFSCRTHWDKKFITQVNEKARTFHLWEMIRPEFFADHFSTKRENILFIGGTNILKGWKEVLQAFNIIKEDLNVNLVIAGYSNQVIINDYITKYKLTNIKAGDIKFKGQLNTEGLIKEFQDSFCMVHPSYIDNSPNSVCEAQVAGLPVIATNVGGVSSLIENMETGILVNLNIKEIADSILTLYNDRKLSKHISMKSREIARKRHCPNTILENTINMYQKLLNG